MSTPGLTITPLFYCYILFYYKNGDVCKKLELKRLRFVRDIRVLSLEKIEPKFLKKFDSGQKNVVNQRVFKILLIFLPHEISKYPLKSIYGSTLIQGVV